MRYRALARGGQAVSALTLRIDDKTPVEVRAPLVVAALDAGVNAFDIGGADPAVLDAIGPVLAEVERRMLFVTIRLGQARDRSGQPVRDFSAERMVRVIEACAARMRVEYIDLALLDDPESSELSTQSLAALKASKAQGRTRWLGVAGQGQAMDAYIASGAFDVLVTPYSLISGWQERNRLKAAAANDMAVMGSDAFPEALRRKSSAIAASGSFLSRLIGKGAAAPRVDRDTGYGFLEHTHGWTAEEICVGYALTEPGLSSVLVAPATPDALAQLATVPEREMPSHLPAQIEMARFTTVAAA